MIDLPLPQILRGSGWHSGSAHLAVASAMQHPGSEVLCSAGPARLSAMRDEITGIVQMMGLPFRDSLTSVRFDNGSRIFFREPRADGVAPRGVLPWIIWLDETAGPIGEREAVSQLRPRSIPLTITIDELR